MQIFTPINRLSISLVMLTISLLLAADLFGFAPNRRAVELEGRKTLVETLAVQLTTAIGAGVSDGLQETLEALVERNAGVLSAAIRRSDGTQVSTAGEHSAHWSLQAEDASTNTQVQVPVYRGERRWGTVEVRFAPLGGASWHERLSGSYLALVLFVAGGGLIAYTLFLKRALRELDPSSAIPERVRGAFDVLAEGLLVLDDKGRVLHANEAFVRRLGVPLESVIGGSATDMQHAQWSPEDPQQPLPWVSILRGVADTAEAPVRVTTGDRKSHLFVAKASAIRGPKGELRGALATFDDVTELERKNAELERTLRQLQRSREEIGRQNQELQKLATRDPLTGCLNRRSLFEHAKRLFADVSDHGEPIACVMVDIDRFKSINDRFGHATGDKIIKLIASVLAESVRSADCVGRYGGEEFCVILAGTGLAPATAIAERMRWLFEQRTTGKLTDRTSVTASFGVAESDAGVASVEELIEHADKALYQAKQGGRNQVGVWEGAEVSIVARGEAPAGEQAGSEPVEPPLQPAAGSQSAEIDPSVALDPQARPLRHAARQRAAAVAPGPGGADSGRDGQVVFHDRIGQAIERAERNRDSMGVLVIGLVTARNVDSTIGYAAREKLIERARRRVAQTLRRSDSVARVIGDAGIPVLSRVGDHELAVLLSELSEPGAATWAVGRIIDAFRQPFDLEGFEVFVDISIGASLYPQDGSDADTLVRYARAARVEAEKDTGSVTCRFYSTDMDRTARQQLQLISDLHKALETEEFVLDYQPVVDLQTASIAGVEALVRWQHPRRGLVGPGQFIAAAEHAGLIDDIGERVMRAACSQLRVWRAAGYEFGLAVNLSPVQFRNPGLAETLIRIVDEFGLPPSCLTVEITESAVIRNVDAAVAITRSLAEKGVGVAIDDFGTGYSSFGYLHQFPFSKLKIDRSFVLRAIEYGADAAIVRAIVSVGHSLELTVVAEGVETAEQLQLCRSLGCDEIQGFLLGKPMPAAELTELLTRPQALRRVLQDAEADVAKVVPLGSPRDPLSAVLNELPESVAD